MRSSVILVMMVALLGVFGCAESDVATPDTIQTIQTIVLDDNGGEYLVTATFDTATVTLEHANLVLTSVGVTNDVDIAVVEEDLSPLSNYTVPAEDPHWETEEHDVQIQVQTNGQVGFLDDRTWNWIDPNVVLDLCPPGHGG